MRRRDCLVFAGPLHATGGYERTQSQTKLTNQMAMLVAWGWDNFSAVLLSMLLLLLLLLLASITSSQDS